MMQVKQYRSLFVFVKRMLDVSLPLLVLYFLALWYGVPWADRYTLLGLIGGVLFVSYNQYLEVYDKWRARSVFGSIQLVIRSWGATVITLIILGFILKRSADFSRFVIGVWSISLPLLVMLQRLVVRAMLRYAFEQGLSMKNVSIVGVGKVGHFLINLFNSTPSLGYRISGLYDDDAKLIGEMIEGVAVIGDLEQACIDAQKGKCDELYLCLPLGAEKHIMMMLDQLAQSTVVVKYVPDLFAFDLLHSKWMSIKGLPVISVYDTPMSSIVARVLKRAEDIVVASIILMIIWPIMVMIAIGVKLTSPGPVFYKQTRIGWNKLPFTILKFRSMPVGAENNDVKWGHANAKTATSFGRFIRATSLDELPQFINVLIGNMSIVGPRPERDLFIEKISREVPRYMQRHMVKSGITGWAQINGLRGDTCLKKRVEYDLYYISNWTVLLDLKIIMMSVFKGWLNEDYSKKALLRKI
jgi:putative colanic acid biosynthesis UDP-glucose lipid carrier transferase